MALFFAHRLGAQVQVAGDLLPNSTDAPSPCPACLMPSSSVCARSVSAHPGGGPGAGREGTGWALGLPCHTPRLHLWHRWG